MHDRIKMAADLIAQQRAALDEIEAACVTLSASGEPLPAVVRAEGLQRTLGLFEEAVGVLRTLRNYAVADAVEAEGASPTRLGRRLGMTRTAVLKICAQAVARASVFAASLYTLSGLSDVFDKLPFS